jgi:hypothetical protein
MILKVLRAFIVPQDIWQEVIDTNPNERRGFGITVHKTNFWHKGGRSVIYTDNTKYLDWPDSQKYRLVYTDFNPDPPKDWTHEREWRKRGDFNLEIQSMPDPCWFPIVETYEDASQIFEKFNKISGIYILELKKWVHRDFYLL